MKPPIRVAITGAAGNIGYALVFRLASGQVFGQLTAIIEADFAPHICSPKKLAVWFAFWGQAKYRPNYLKIPYKYDDKRFMELTRLCGEIVSEGSYGHLETASVARCIEAIVDGLWLNMMMYPKEVSREQARDDCFRFLSQVFFKHFSDQSK